MCGERTAATKHLRLHRLPRVLLLHIKRFRCAGATREKITTNVAFPLKVQYLQTSRLAWPACCHAWVNRGFSGVAPMLARCNILPSGLTQACRALC